MNETRQLLEKKSTVEMFFAYGKASYEYDS